MIRVIFDPVALSEPEQKELWRKWQRRADKATDTLIKSFEDWLEGGRKTPLDFKFRSRIWGRLKDWLSTNVFHEKCAYCECPIFRFPGDAEHFRPKGAVTYKDDAGALLKPSCQIIDPATGEVLEMPHPGYFWLAYDWRNLVPSCSFCNSGRGKNERFDTQAGHIFLVELDEAAVKAMPPEVRPKPSRWKPRYYPTAAMLEKQESPLFLNPLNPSPDRNPRDHIRFGQRGTVAAVKGSAAADRTIQIFGLDNEKLRVARQNAQYDFQLAFFNAMQDKDGPLKAQTLLDEYAAGKHPFSAAVLDYHRILDDLRPRPII